MAKKSGRQMTRVFHCLMLKQVGGIVARAIVTTVENGSVHLFIPQMNTSGKLLVKDLPNEVKGSLFCEESSTYSLLFKGEGDLLDY
jgi:hypothetical protein